MEEKVRPKDELKLRVKNAKGKTILETKVIGDIEKVLSRKPKRAIQIVLRRNESGPYFVHVHCKACGNDWKIEESKDPSEKFEIQEIQPTLWHIKCKKCGIEFESG